MQGNQQSIKSNNNTETSTTSSVNSKNQISKKERKSLIQIIVIIFVAIFGLVALFPVSVSCGSPSYTCATPPDENGRILTRYETTPFVIMILESIFNTNIPIYYVAGTSESFIEISEKTCEYNGQTFYEGDNFDSDDGCNTCTCNNGGVVCTEIHCAENEPNSQQNSDITPIEPSESLTNIWTNENYNIIPNQTGTGNIFTTDDWETFDYILDSAVIFSINYPTNWVDSGSSIDSQDEMQGMSTPKLLVSNSGLTCFDTLPTENHQSDSGFYNTFIDQDTINIDGLNGIKRITSVSEGGYDMSDRTIIDYCIYKNSSQAAILTFYYRNSIEPNTELFEQIVKSFTIN